MGYRYDTSKPAYEEAKKTIGENQATVLNAIRELCRTYGKCNDKQISTHLGWEINRITNRRGELLQMGLIEDLGKFNNDRGVKVHYWKPKVRQQPGIQNSLFNDAA